jgi:hypothetical protein
MKPEKKLGDNISFNDDESYEIPCW